MFGVVCSASNASILIECTGSAKWGENNNEDDADDDPDADDGYLADTPDFGPKYY